MNGANVAAVLAILAIGCGSGSGGGDTRPDAMPSPATDVEASSQYVDPTNCPNADGVCAILVGVCFNLTTPACAASMRCRSYAPACAPIASFCCYRVPCAADAADCTDVVDDAGVEPVDVDALEVGTE